MQSSSQKGQSLVEFAFIVPFIMFLFLALIYGGILFLDFIQYNNAARSIARDAAFSSKSSFDDSDISSFKQKFNPLSSLYSPELIVQKNLESSTVTVKILLTRSIDLNLFFALSSDDIGFPPKNLKPIVFTMPIEQASISND